VTVTLELEGNREFNTHVEVLVAKEFHNQVTLIICLLQEWDRFTRLMLVCMANLANHNYALPVEIAFYHNQLLIVDMSTLLN
jgi:hypothetical protein